MITNLSIIKFFFLIVLFNFSKVTALTPPVAEARPEIKIEKYQDVFAQIKKQNWVMAITLADDSNNKDYPHMSDGLTLQDQAVIMILII